MIAITGLKVIELELVAYDCSKGTIADACINDERRMSESKPDNQ